MEEGIIIPFLKLDIYARVLPPSGDRWCVIEFVLFHSSVI